MKMHDNARRLWSSKLWHTRGILFSVLFGAVVAPSHNAYPAQGHSAKKQSCTRAVIEGDVKAGEAFDAVFTSSLRFYLEPLPSGWIVRVLAADGSRGPHDYAEIASPPYRSVSPLLISTDWSFRAQDAVGWNPRRFHFAATTQAFETMSRLYAGAMANDPESMGKVAQLVSEQPEAVLEILDARLVPGVADQSRMASMVALHLGETPHTADQSAAASPLGKLLEVRFRVSFDLPLGVHAAKGVMELPRACPVRPTEAAWSASQRLAHK